MDVKHIPSDTAANIRLLSQAEQMRQGEYVQLVTAQQTASVLLAVLLKAWCQVALGSAGHGEQTLSTDQDKEALHQACRL
jgi:signal-transduction protein with cAMP-binding, CBS, and nucleotidyltransferase domain